MNSFIKEYGMFFLACVGFIFVVFMFNYGKVHYKQYAQAFIGNLTGVESSEFISIEDM